MKTPRSIKWAVWRLRWWRQITIITAPCLCFLGWMASRKGAWPVLLAVTLVVLMGAGIAACISRRSSARVRWLKYSSFKPMRRRGRFNTGPRRFGEETPDVPRFEVDLPCEKCSAPNIGAEAGEDEVGRVFRSCDTCGHTQWWTREQDPPGVMPRERPPQNQPPRQACPRCEYALAGIPLKQEDRGTGKAVFVQQCPECGRAEIVVPLKPRNKAVGSIKG